MEVLKNQLEKVIELFGIGSVEALRASQLLDIEIVKEQEKLRRTR